MPPSSRCSPTTSTRDVRSRIKQFTTELFVMDATSTLSRVSATCAQFAPTLTSAKTVREMVSTHSTLSSRFVTLLRLLIS